MKVTVGANSVRLGAESVSVLSGFCCQVFLSALCAVVWVRLLLVIIVVIMVSVLEVQIPDVTMWGGCSLVTSKLRPWWPLWQPQRWCLKWQRHKLWFWFEGRGDLNWWTSAWDTAYTPTQTLFCHFRGLTLMYIHFVEILSEPALTWSNLLLHQH